MKWFRRQWHIHIICGHCGYKLRNWNTKGLSGILAPIGNIADVLTCPSCKRNAQWWINVEPL